MGREGFALQLVESLSNAGDLLVPVKYQPGDSLAQAEHYLTLTLKNIAVGSVVESPEKSSEGTTASSALRIASAVAIHKGGIKKLDVAIARPDRYI